MPAHYAGLAGMELILEVGVENIQERLRDLTDRILERCDQAGVKTFTPRERATALRDRDPRMRQPRGGREPACMRKA